MGKSNIKALLFICSFLLITLSLTADCFAFQINCQVTRVLDGDTFHCLPETKAMLYTIPEQKITAVKPHKDGTITVRMRGIDAPEKRQPYGEDARLSLKEMIGNKSVKLEIKDIDKYGRAVAYVWLGTLNVNLEQVKRGYAWAYTEYLDRPYVSEFYEAEKQARKQKLGLWQQNNPTPPWEWRKKNR